jgi:23S rRNA (pseudouridine1915-N3)-methyltransferase
MRDRPVAFVVGGAAGLDPTLVAECDERLSLGPLTMPHQLARVVLAEQIYRALCIASGHPYPH